MEGREGRDGLDGLIWGLEGWLGLGDWRPGGRVWSRRGCRHQEGRGGGARL